MTTKTDYDKSAQEAWEAKIDALHPDAVFVEVALDPSPLHRYLEDASFLRTENARDHRNITHAVYQTLRRMADVEIEFTVRQPAYAGEDHGEIYQVTGRVIESDGAILGLNGDPVLVVKPDKGRTIMFPARYVDGMRVAR